MADDLIKQILDLANQDRKHVGDAVKSSMVSALGPILDRIEKSSNINKQELIRALSSIKVSVSPQVNIPEQPAAQIRVNVPDIKVPTPQVTVQAPRVPDIHIPPAVFPSDMQTTLKGVNYKTPLPVMVVNPTGGPRGGLSLSDIVTPSGDSVMDSVNKAIKVNVVAGSVSLSGNDTNIGPSGANTLRVTIATDSNASVNITGSTGTLGVSVVDSTGVAFEGSNAFPVSITGSTGTLGATIVDSSGVAYSGSNPVPTTASLSAATGQGDTASALRVVSAGDSQASVVVNGWNNGSAVDTNSGPVGSQTLRVTQAVDVASSVSIVSITGPIAQGDSASALRVVQAGDVASSVSITSITGPIAQGDSASALRIIQAGDSVSSVVVNSGTITTVTTLTGVTNSIQATIVDSSGVGYSGSNALPVTVTGSTGSIVVVGDVVSGATDDGSPPNKQGGLASSTNHTRVTDGQRVSFIADLAGRQIVVPQQPRQLVSTANVLLTRGALTSILTAGASTFLDIVAISCANASSNAVPVLLYESDSGANVYTVQIPANATAGISFQVPLPQTTTAQTWTAKVSGTDISDSNVTLFLEAVQNI